MDALVTYISIINSSLIRLPLERWHMESCHLLFSYVQSYLLQCHPLGRSYCECLLIWRREWVCKYASRIHCKSDLCSKSLHINKKIKALHLHLQCILQTGKQQEKKVVTMRLNGLSKTQKICAMLEPLHQYLDFQLKTCNSLQSNKCIYTALN